MIWNYNEYRECLPVIMNRFTTTENVTTILTTRCLSRPGSVEWEGDPCCNPVVLREQPCVARAQNITFNTYSLINDSFVNNCNNSVRAVQTLQDLQVILNNQENPSHGCDASLSLVLNDPTTNAQLAEAFTCINAFSDTTSVPCNSTADCPNNSPCNRITGFCGQSLFPPASINQVFCSFLLFFLFSFLFLSFLFSLFFPSSFLFPFSSFFFSLLSFLFLFPLSPFFSSLLFLFSTKSVF